jgi:hypothetical protein
VVADIGGDRGALIMHVPSGWLGREMEIRRPPEPWSGIHVGVIARHLSDRTEYSAFFPSLLSGEYEIRPMIASRMQPPVTELRTAQVASGSVTDIYWNTSVARNKRKEKCDGR